MKPWLNQHLQALVQVLLRMRHNLIATLFMCGVMGATLCLPGMLYVIVDNLNRLAVQVTSEPQITLFLKLDSNAATIGAIDKLLSAQANIDHYQFVDKTNAWKKFQESANNTDAAASLDKNPLPDDFFVYPKNIDSDTIEHLQTEMQQWDGVDLAQADAPWIKRLNAILKLAKTAIWVLVGLLSFALFAIIGNTVRLQILTQRAEIEVNQLIGATNGFVRRPFLYAGTLYGLGGGIAAWLMLVAVIRLFNRSVAEIAALYVSDFSLTLPPANIITTLLLSAVFLGWIAAYFAVSHSLARLHTE